MDTIEKFSQVLDNTCHIKPYHRSLNTIISDDDKEINRLPCCNKDFNHHFLQFDMIISQSINVKSIDKINFMLNSQGCLSDTIFDTDSQDYVSNQKDVLARSKSLNNETLKYPVLQLKPVTKKVEVKKGLYKRPHFDATFELFKTAGILKTEKELIHYRTTFDEVNFDFVEVLPYSILRRSLFSPWKEKEDIIVIPPGHPGSILTVSILYPDIDKLVLALIKRDSFLRESIGGDNINGYVTFINIIRKLE